MKVALISAVHSNLPALEAVLDDITGVGVDARWPSSSAPVPWSSLAAAPLGRKQRRRGLSRPRNLRHGKARSVEPDLRPKARRRSYACRLSRPRDHGQKFLPRDAVRASDAETPDQSTARRSVGGLLHAQEVEATTGFEPVNRGFADLRVEPLHHVARRDSTRGRPGGWLPLEDSNLGSRIQSPLSYH